MKVVGSRDHLLPHLLRSQRYRLQPFRHQSADWYHLPLRRGGFGLEHPRPARRRLPSSSGEGAQCAHWAGGERAHHRWMVLDPSVTSLRTSASSPGRGSLERSRMCALLSIDHPPSRRGGMPSSSGEGAQLASWAGGERAHYRYMVLDLSAPVCPLGQLPWKREPIACGRDEGEASLLAAGSFDDHQYRTRLYISTGIAAATGKAETVPHFHPVAIPEVLRTCAAREEDAWTITPLHPRTHSLQNGQNALSFHNSKNGFLSLREKMGFWPPSPRPGGANPRTAVPFS